MLPRLLTLILLSSTSFWPVVHADSERNSLNGLARNIRPEFSARPRWTSNNHVIEARQNSKQSNQQQQTKTQNKPTNTPSPSSSSKPKPKVPQNAGAIAGIVIGSIIGATILIAACWLLKSRYSTRRKNKKDFAAHAEDGEAGGSRSSDLPFAPNVGSPPPMEEHLNHDQTTGPSRQASMRSNGSALPNPYTHYDGLENVSNYPLPSERYSGSHQALLSDDPRHEDGGITQNGARISSAYYPSSPPPLPPAYTPV